MDWSRPNLNKEIEKKGSERRESLHLSIFILPYEFLWFKEHAWKKKKIWNDIEVL